MKKNSSASRRRRAGFTLVELLTVIAIIGILAALLLPVLAAVKKSTQRAKAKMEANDIATAIQSYDSFYGRLPVSPAVQAAANPDFTYGGMFQSPTAPQSVGTMVNGSIISNAEVIAILMDLTNYPGGGWTVNTNYQKNPQQHIFLNAKTSGDNSSPGVGNDLVYRDPWGNPYVITMDLNYDDFCVDIFYRKNAISSSGLFGLIQDTSVPGPDNWAYRGKVMVWSAGPDGLVDPASGTGSANKDNVLTWQ